MKIKYDSVFIVLKFVLFFGFIFFGILYIINVKTVENSLKIGFKREIQNEYCGILVKKYYDKANHNSPIIVFSNNTSTGLNGKFWGQMEEGDSISKIKGDSIIQVFRGGKRIDIEIAPFYQKAIQNEIEKKNKR